MANMHITKLVPVVLATLGELGDRTEIGAVGYLLEFTIGCIADHRDTKRALELLEGLRPGVEALQAVLVARSHAELAEELREALASCLEHINQREAEAIREAAIGQA